MSVRPYVSIFVFFNHRTDLEKKWRLVLSDLEIPWFSLVPKFTSTTNSTRRPGTLCHASMKIQIRSYELKFEFETLPSRMMKIWTFKCIMRIIKYQNKNKFWLILVFQPIKTNFDECSRQKWYPELKISPHKTHFSHKFKSATSLAKNTAAGGGNSKYINMDAVPKKFDSLFFFLRMLVSGERHVRLD